MGGMLILAFVSQFFLPVCVRVHVCVGVIFAPADLGKTVQLLRLLFGSSPIWVLVCRGLSVKRIYSESEMKTELMLGWLGFKLKINSRRNDSRVPKKSLCRNAHYNTIKPINQGRNMGSEEAGRYTVD